MSIHRYRYRHAMILFHFFQSTDKFLDTADTFAYNVHQIYATSCKLLDYYNVLVDPKYKIEKSLLVLFSNFKQFSCIILTE